MTEFRSLVRTRHWIGFVCLALLSAAPSYAQEIRIVDLPANDIIYDAVRQRIYASVPSAAGFERGNTITTIDPRTGTIESSVFIGSEPGQLAISDDGQFLYVGLDGAASIRRFDIASQTAGLQFWLGSGRNGPLIAEDIEVLPGNPHAVAVSRKYADPYVSPRYHSVVVFDDGVARPNILQSHTGSNRIEFSDTADLLFGFNNETTAFTLRKIEVNGDGLLELAAVDDLVSAFGADIMYVSGRIYGTTGVIIDPDTLAIRNSLNLIPLNPSVSGENQYNGLLALVPHQKRLYMLMWGKAGDWNLHGFHLGSLRRLDSQQLFDGSRIDFGPVGNMIAWGNGGLAFRTNTDQTYILPESPFTNDDVILDFGSSVGLLEWKNDSEWLPLDSQSPEILVSGDLDNNGQSDAVFDFGETGGTQKWMNDTLWVSLHEASPQTMVIADIEGNARGVRPWDLPVPIPDNDIAGVVSTVTVDQDVPVQDVNVRVIIKHTWIGDLILKLRSPAGTETFLLSMVGGNGACPDDNMDVTFDDDIVNAGNVEWHCPHVDPWFRGLANTDYFFGSLDVFDGESSKGEWSLIASDLQAGDVGSLIDWELILTPSVGALPSRDDLVVGAAPHGTWNWMNDRMWSQLHNQSPDSMVAGDLDGNGRGDVVAAAAAFGTWKRMNDKAWIKLHDLAPDSMVTGDLDGNGQDDVVFGFGATEGTKIWMNDSAWVQLDSLSAEDMVTGDLDGNGEDDVVIDFGVTEGTRVWMNNIEWAQLHSLSPDSMVTGDLDRNGQDDVILGLGPEEGTWKWMNNKNWVRLHDLSSEALVTGNFDGN